MAEAVRARRLTDQEGQRLQQILHARQISFQRTRTWKESADPDKDAKLERIEHVTGEFPDRCFAFDQFGPLSIRPCHGTCYVICDNLSANKTPAIRAWAAKHKVRLCFTPVNASWANPIEAQFGPLRTFVIGSSDHPSLAVLAGRLQAYLAWRNVINPSKRFMGSALASAGIASGTTAIMSAGDESILAGDDTDVCACITLLPR
jgi:hypothetical protein